MLEYKESSDPNVSQAGIEVRTERKCRAHEAVDQAESRLCHRALMGTVTIGRAGLGSIPTISFNNLKGKVMRDLVQKGVRAGAREERASHIVGLRQKNAWSRWEQAMKDFMV